MSEELKVWIDNKKHEQAARLLDVKAQIKKLKEEEETLSDELKAAVSDVEDSKLLISDNVEAKTYRVTFSEGTRKTLKREILLEQGVKPSQLLKATVESKYNQLRVTEYTPEEDTDEED